MVFGTATGFLDVGIVLLLAIALSEYFKWRSKADKGFAWLALAGIFFIFAGTFGEATTLPRYVTASAWDSLGSIFEVLGWLFGLIGTIFVAYETLIEK